MAAGETGQLAGVYARGPILSPTVDYSEGSYERFGAYMLLLQCCLSLPSDDMPLL